VAVAGFSLRRQEAGVLKDESGTHISMDRLRSRAPRGVRAYGRVPKNRGKNLTLIASMLTKPPMFLSEAFCFYLILQVKKRADERTRTAGLSLRVCGQWLLGVACACNFCISKRFSVPSVAQYCRGLRPGKGQIRVNQPRRILVLHTSRDRHVADGMDEALG
jgi:hypothetical protein